MMYTFSHSKKKAPTTWDVKAIFRKKKINESLRPKQMTGFYGSHRNHKIHKTLIFVTLLLKWR